MYILAPSVYAADYIHLEKQLFTLKNEGAKYLHIDIMDGHFVPNLSFGPGLVAALKPYSDLIFDIHLMVSEPEYFIKDFSNAGADCITVHLETGSDIEKALYLIRMEGCRAGIVLKPETPVEAIGSELWKQIDVIQLMTTAPGLPGQKFIPASLERIKKTRELIERKKYGDKTGMIGKTIDLEVDGDITPGNLEGVLLAGANIIVAGKGLFAGNLESNIRAYLRIMAQAGRRQCSI